MTLGNEFLGQPGNHPLSAAIEFQVYQPINPSPSRSRGERELPAYVSNGLIGLRVRDVPLTSGMALVSGFAGEHPERRIEATAAAPYPLAGDVAINGVWLSDAPHQVRNLEQSYDFSTGELTSAFGFSATDVSLRCEILDIRQPRGSDPGLPGGLAHLR